MFWICWFYWPRSDFIKFCGSGSWNNQSRSKSLKKAYKKISYKHFFISKYLLFIYNELFAYQISIQLFVISDTIPKARFTSSCFKGHKWIYHRGAPSLGYLHNYLWYPKIFIRLHQETKLELCCMWIGFYTLKATYVGYVYQCRSEYLKSN